MIGGGGGEIGVFRKRKDDEYEGSKVHLYLNRVKCQILGESDLLQIKAK